MGCLITIAILLFLAIPIGFYHEMDQRINGLEKVLSAARKEQVRTPAPDLRTQKLCADQARQFFRDTKDEDSSVIGYTDHFNEILGKCFIQIDGNSKGLLFSSIYDAFEGTGYGYIYHDFGSPKARACNIVSIDLKSHDCDSLEEFNRFSKAYLGDIPPKN